ncbi:MAG: hypothetical protein ACK4QP_07395 [Pseudorhizobium sp.]
MEEPGRWRQMRSAPKDGSRILVTIRSSEQGPGAVDLVYWAKADPSGGDAWRSSDSAPGAVIEYAEPELKCWMPLPTVGPSANEEPLTRPAAWEGQDEEELDGSGI